MKKIFMEKSIIAILVVAVFAIGVSVFAGAEKVTICHVAAAADGSQTVQENSITIGAKAAQKHLDEHRADYKGECQSEQIVICHGGFAFIEQTDRSDSDTEVWVETTLKLSKEEANDHLLNHEKDYRGECGQTDQIQTICHGEFVLSQEHREDSDIEVWVETTLKLSKEEANDHLLTHRGDYDGECKVENPLTR